MTKIIHGIVLIFLGLIVVGMGADTGESVVACLGSAVFILGLVDTIIGIARKVKKKGKTKSVCKPIPAKKQELAGAPVVGANIPEAAPKPEDAPKSEVCLTEKTEKQKTLEEEIADEVIKGTGLKPEKSFGHCDLSPDDFDHLEGNNDIWLRLDNGTFRDSLFQLVKNLDVEHWFDVRRDRHGRDRRFYILLPGKEALTGEPDAEQLLALCRENHVVPIMPFSKTDYLNLLDGLTYRDMLYKELGHGEIDVGLRIQEERTRLRYQWLAKERKKTTEILIVPEDQEKIERYQYSLLDTRCVIIKGKATHCRIANECFSGQYCDVFFEAKVLDETKLAKSYTDIVTESGMWGPEKVWDWFGTCVGMYYTGDQWHYNEKGEPELNKV